MSSFATAPEVMKVLMGIQMIIGRLGIYSILLVFVLYRKRVCLDRGLYSLVGDLQPVVFLILMTDAF